MTTTHPTGVNHLAIATRDIKTQIAFFTDVLGCPLKALYRMHGAEGAWHGFVELNPESYIAFVFHPANPDARELGVTHAAEPAGPAAAGAMQHVALHVRDLDELLTLRDRIRSRGIVVLGPIDHGFCRSIYLAGPEGLLLELTTGDAIDDRAWIDPEVVAINGISPDELETYRHPAAFTRPADPVPQPAYDPATPHMAYPDEVYRQIITMPDDMVWQLASQPDPPIRLD
ncbi:VOC family protein [Nocardia terpenica]|uniref:VOC family protein n=1 Tax=Nocardia terpenica TaxID=455432 RepID=UPI0018933CC5|nr:VOC family protein [Nocardia terpenica]MBF6065356.1 VOC family protein [Nocardia terpenica]MBF6108928.1 VOC family protein [Nocardia terpenica]MBF6121771.1 VOC family protein [Nocardia terpenica]